MNRCYVGVMLPDTVSAALCRATAAERDRTAGEIDWTPRDALHLTLLFLGDVDDLAVVSRRLDATATALVPGALSLGAPSTWLGPHLVAPVTGADNLAGALRSHLGDLSHDPFLHTRDFFGHVTLGRVPGHAERKPLDLPVPAVSWRVDEIALIQSLASSSDARYAVRSVAALGSPV